MTKARRWEQPKCPSIDGWTGKTKCHVSIRGNIIQPQKRRKFWHMLQCGWTLKTLCWVKEVRHKRLDVVWFHLHEMSGIDESTEKESSLVVARRAVGSDCHWVWSFLLRWWNCLGTRQRRWLHNTVNVLNATELFTLKRLVNFMFCEFYLNCNRIVRDLRGIQETGEAATMANPGEKHWRSGSRMLGRGVQI